jgi:hypothetical protein
MNKLIVAVVVLAALVGGFFLLGFSNPQENQESNNKDAASLIDGESAVSPPSPSAFLQKEQPTNYKDRDPVSPPPPTPQVTYNQTQPTLEDQHSSQQSASTQVNSDEPPL